MRSIWLKVFFRSIRGNRRVNAFHELLIELELVGELISILPGGSAFDFSGGVILVDQEGLIQVIPGKKWNLIS